MKKIYFLHEHPTKLGNVIEYRGFRATVTEDLIELNPELFTVKDPMQELLDKAKRDYPIGTMFNSKYGVQKVLSDEPFVGIDVAGTVQIYTDLFPGGATIYTPEDGWAEILPLKFTTEDGVDIYGDMKTYFVHPSDDCDIDYYHSLWNGNSETKFSKYFYHKGNALAYIKKHKEKPLEEYENILIKSKSFRIVDKDGIETILETRHFYQYLKEIDPKLYYTKILQLIVDDLNDGRYIHERGQPSFHINKEGRVTLHMGDDEGCVYFKSGDLAEKARDILGDKLEYLFN